MSRTLTQTNPNPVIMNVLLFSRLVATPRHIGDPFRTLGSATHERGHYGCNGIAGDIVVLTLQDVDAGPGDRRGGLDGGLLQKFGPPGSAEDESGGADPAQPPGWDRAVTHDRRVVGECVRQVQADLPVGRLANPCDHLVWNADLPHEVYEGVISTIRREQLGQ